MSRIGKLPVNLPAGVTVTVSPDNVVSVKGPLGTLSQKVDSDIKVEVGTCLLYTSGGLDPCGETAQVGDRQLGSQESFGASGRYEAVRQGDLRRRRPDAQTYPGSSPRSRTPYSQAFESRDDRSGQNGNRRKQVAQWDRK